MLANNALNVLHSLTKLSKDGKIIGNKCVTNIVTNNTSIAEVHIKQGDKFTAKFFFVTAGPWLEILIKD